MIKVMHVLTDTNVGGAGRYLQTLLSCVDRNRYDVSVVLPRDAAMTGPIEKKGIRVIPVDGCRDRSFSLKDVRLLKEIFLRERPDVVHTHACLSARLAATQCRIPGRIYTRHCHFTPPAWLTHFPGRQINGILTRRLSTDVIAVAKATKETLVSSGIPEDMISVIPNGVFPVRQVSPEELAGLRRTLDIPDDAFVCGMVARLEPYKGQEELLDIAAALAESHPRVIILLIGSGSQADFLAEKIRRNHITNVRMVGEVNDVAPYYRLMRLHLNNASGTESSSMAIHEAKSAGVPTIATQYGGNPETVTDGVDGLLVRVHAMGDFYEAICRLADDPAMLDALSEGAKRQYDANEAAELMTERTERIWEKYAPSPSV